MSNSKDFKYKEYIRLLEKWHKLRDKLKELPNVELSKPYQQGWIIFYDLREDIKRRQDYPLLKDILDLAYSNTRTNKVDVVRGIRKKDKTVIIKNKWGKSSSIISYFPSRRRIYEKTFNQFDRKYKEFFFLDTSSEIYTKYGRKEYLCNFPSYWLVCKVKPYMITHKYTKGGEIEQEYEQISHRLWRSGEFYSMFEGYGKSFPVSKDRAKVRDAIQKFIKGEAEDIFNEKTPLEYDY